MTPAGKLSRRGSFYCSKIFNVSEDKSIVDFYDDLARRTNRSRNELIGLALDFAKDKIIVES